MRDTKSPHALLEEAATELEQCLHKFMNNEPIDLKEFDRKAQAACDTIQNLPKEQAIVFKDDLEAISHALSVLSDKMEERYNALKHELSGVDAHRAAHTAYAKNAIHNNE